MNFNAHSALEGKHAFLSPSNYHWTNYTEQKLTARYISAKAARRGTDLHDYAMRAITLGIKQPRTKTTIAMYVNDAIGFKMDCEQALYYSDNCFGTADTISFRNRMLRIHDLKTGITPSSVRQLEVYAAIFCLEYGHSPFEIQMEFRIYQSDEVKIYDGDPIEILRIMDQIIYCDRQIELLKEGGL